MLIIPNKLQNSEQILYTQFWVQRKHTCTCVWIETTNYLNNENYGISKFKKLCDTEFRTEVQTSYFFYLSIFVLRKQKTPTPPKKKQQQKTKKNIWNNVHKFSLRATPLISFCEPCIAKWADFEWSWEMLKWESTDLKFSEKVHIPIIKVILTKMNHIIQYAYRLRPTVHKTLSLTWTEW